MLSRLAFRNFQVLPTAVRALQTTASAPSTPSTSISSDHPPRPVRRDRADPVKHGFIPAEWFSFFYPKTGVSGPYCFIGTFGTYLLSKEWFVMEHEYYNGLSFIIIWIIIVKKYGPSLSAYLQKEQEQMENDMLEGRQNELQALDDNIKDLEKEKWRAEGQRLIYEIKKENVFIQLEAAYRERIAKVYEEVKKRLDYQLQLDMVQRRLAQKQMSQWIIDSVMKSLTPELEKQALQKCITDLQGLAKA